MIPIGASAHEVSVQLVKLGVGQISACFWLLIPHFFCFNCSRKSCKLSDNSCILSLAVCSSVCSRWLSVVGGSLSGVGGSLSVVGGPLSVVGGLVDGSVGRFGCFLLHVIAFR